MTAIESLRRLPSGKTMVTGYPVREEFWLTSRREGRQRLGLDAEEKVLLVSGASSGAHSINRSVASDLPGLLELCEVVHLSGAQDAPWLAEIHDSLPKGLRERYHLHGYLHEDTPWAMAAADLALCRAGAPHRETAPSLKRRDRWQRGTVPLRHPATQARRLRAA